MKIIDAGFQFQWSTPNVILKLENIARVCYKSEELKKPSSDKKLIKKILEMGHLSIFDHVQACVKFIIDRGISHELVRHRIGVGFAQESTRYCNYSNNKFGKEITVIRPFFWESGCRKFNIWVDAMCFAETAYMNLLDEGATPQEARSVLPNSLKTEIIVTADFTEWRHIFLQRTSIKAHPQMQQVMIPCLKLFRKKWPEIFGDIK